MASKAVVGILIGCAAIMVVGAVVIIGGGWYLKTKVEKKLNEATKSQSVAELWSDVPRMDDLKRSDMDMPVGMKLIIQPIMNRVLGEGTHTGDWIIFTTSKKPDDIKYFYTNAKMTSFGGWDASDKSTCLTGASQNIPQVGLFCVFQKKANNKDVGLMILTGPYDQTKEMNVFFMRIEAPQSSTPKQPTSPPPKQTTREVTALTGTAPYGIEKRPIPAGLDLDQLLPKQVGSYTRTKLEMSSQRGVQPSSIEIDGNSVYATYQSDGAEIFVEFAISSTAANAQMGLDVAATEVTDKFPTDPRFGSIGTDPSYLKVNNEYGAFFAWTRGGYYFSANAKNGDAALDAFLQSFPY